jgi:glycosyltransferase involved in cell wall biosynthesis
VFKGFLPSLRDALKDSILLVPLRIGSGLRTKILDAFSLKVPVISTSIGIDGIPAIHGEHCLIADNPESIAAMISSLIQDEKLVEGLTENAFCLLEEHFSNPAIYKQRIEFYQSLLLSE